MRKQNQKVQTRQITAGVTLTGTKSVEWWDEQVRKDVAARKENFYTKDVYFTPDFQLKAEG
jgi:hypothetical protein